MGYGRCWRTLLHVVDSCMRQAMKDGNVTNSKHFLCVSKIECSEGIECVLKNLGRGTQEWNRVAYRRDPTSVAYKHKERIRQPMKMAYFQYRRVGAGKHYSAMVRIKGLWTMIYLVHYVLPNFTNAYKQWIIRVDTSCRLLLWLNEQLNSKMLVRRWSE